MTERRSYLLAIYIFAQYFLGVLCLAINVEQRKNSLNLDTDLRYHTVSQMTVETKPSQGQNDATRDGKPPVESKEDGNVSSWAEVMGLQRFLVAMARYPLHNLGMAVSSFKQGIASLRGTQFKPATDIQDQSGKVILVTGGLFNHFEFQSKNIKLTRLNR